MPGIPPYRWLLAEALAWPFRSKLAFDRQCIVLARSHTGTLNGCQNHVRITRDLAQELETWLQPRARGLSLETLRNLREQAWFARGARRRSLAAYLTWVAAEHLDFDGICARLAPEGDRRDDVFAPHGDLSHAERVMRWRFLSLCLPADLLVAAVASTRGCTPTSEHVDIGSPDLTRLLEEPVAETHLHVGAALGFPVLWTGLMSNMDRLPSKARKLARGGTPPFGGSAHLMEKLVAAALARWTMARYLCDPHGARGTIRAYVMEPGHLSAIAWSAGASDLVRRLRRALGWLVECAPADERLVRERRAEMMLLYRTLKAATRASARGRHDGGTHGVAMADPLARWFPPVIHGALPETHLAARALTYLNGTGAGDTGFAYLFWQYQRVRTQLFRFLTIEAGTEGLDWFRQHYERISALREPLDRFKYRIALETESRGLRLAAIELRTAPERSCHANLREVRTLVDQACAWQAAAASGSAPRRIVAEEPAGTALEFGLVLHWIKKRECGSGRLTEDPRHPAFPSRYGAWFHNAYLEATAVARMLRERPGTLHVLRGIDVANTELAMGTWVTIPLIQKVRQAAHEAAHALARGGVAARPLRVTYHAGEEYRHALEGLRRVHELIEFSVLGRGDRIGHGLVLGEDVPRHWRTRPVVPQPLQERLDDLLWEWGRYVNGEVSPPAGRETMVRTRAVALGRALYRSDVSLDDLVAARQWRHRPAALDRLGYPSCHPEASRAPGILGLLYRYLTDPDVFERGQCLIDIQITDLEIEATTRLQAWLRTEASARAITVESNPSSNWLIADMDDMRSHPSLVLQPLEGDPLPAGDRLSLSINSDDPLTFATCLADEYAYFYAALVHAGMATSRALAWLDRARRAGMQSRFTCNLLRCWQSP